jgi:hypothetical protein
MNSVNQSQNALPDNRSIDLVEQIPDFSLNIFDGFILSSPFWIASSHYTGKTNAIKSWSPFVPAAVTLKINIPSEGQSVGAN